MNFFRNYGLEFPGLNSPFCHCKTIKTFIHQLSWLLKIDGLTQLSARITPPPQGFPPWVYIGGSSVFPCPETTDNFIVIRRIQQWWPNRVLNPGEQPVANAAPLRPTLPETKTKYKSESKSKAKHNQMRDRSEQSRAERPGPKESISNGWPYAGALCRMINGVKMPMWRHIVYTN